MAVQLDVAAGRTSRAEAAGWPAGLAGAILLGGLLLVRGSPGSAAEAPGDAPPAQIRIEPGHPWRPPFALERIGSPVTVVVEMAADPQPRPAYWLVAYLRGKEMSRSELALPGKAPCACRVSLDRWPTELVLVGRSADGAVKELARQKVEPVPFEADAVAQPDRVINPVDLGAILAPSDWLLLAGGQKGSV